MVPPPSLKKREKKESWLSQKQPILHLLKKNISDYMLWFIVSTV